MIYDNKRLIEIEMLAKDEKEMPTSLSHSETLLYHQFALLYLQVKRKMISVPEAKERKVQIIDSFKEMYMWEQIFLEDCKVRNELNKYIAMGRYKSMNREELINVLEQFEKIMNPTNGGKLNI